MSDYSEAYGPSELREKVAAVWGNYSNERTLISEIGELVIDEREKYSREKVLEALDRLENKVLLINCEPECDAVTHARHDGSWRTHTSMEQEIEAIRKELE
jgi:hypothetical protein